MLDISDTLVAKSDFITGDDLIAGPITAKIVGVKRDGPRDVHIQLDGGHKPWNTNLTSRRLLAIGWGTTDAHQWVGKSVTIHRDPDLQWEGKKVGGALVCGMSHIERGFTAELTFTKGRKKKYSVTKLATEGAPTANLAAYIIEAGLTIKAIDAWRATNDKPPVSEMTDEHRAKFAGWLAGNDKALHEIRGLMSTMGATDE